ncbi:carboxypeptidase-like regulatory domain-containing protein [Pontibacter harenae]|uniref:carboxypeptidase-like regulatory domain-containing protein n=1 Tax=Pontibacter harenae TaxID=2894083 RepID=UPI001E546C59|nr:carboxypeptidase-like regulatory domain-containing protein [Pontibacter harenae]MCC9166740.1 carboxypeptidase-like regulatory domain-containing protein [Pontibacter harenae]
MKFSIPLPDKLEKKVRQGLFAMLAFVLIGISMPQSTMAQGQKRVVQLSGFVAFGDSLFGIGGVNVYVPETTRGSMTNEFGFFSMPVVTGDSVLFSALGYKTQYLIIPKNFKNDSYSVIIQMQEDAVTLPEITVIPWATERDFKNAVLAVKLPDEGRAIATQNLDPKRLEELFLTTPMDGGGNFRFWNQQQIQQQQNRIMYPTISPFAIPALINSIFKGNN